MLTIASWGTAEDRPEREAMRSLLIGRSFMAAFREARGGEKKHRLGWSFDWIREKTASELRWMWSSDRAYKDEHADAYAQVAGDLLLDISARFGWLFEPACLEYDGWVLVELKAKDDSKYDSWVKPAGSSY